MHRLESASFAWRTEDVFFASSKESVGDVGLGQFAKSMI
jgi:hypothetical protein